MPQQLSNVRNPKSERRMMKKGEVRKNCYNGCHGNIVDSKIKQTREPHQPQVHPIFAGRNRSSLLHFHTSLLIARA